MQKQHDAIASQHRVIRGVNDIIKHANGNILYLTTLSTWNEIKFAVPSGLPQTLKGASQTQQRLKFSLSALSSEQRKQNKCFKIPPNLQLKYCSVNSKVIIICFYYFNLLLFANCREKECKLVKMSIVFLCCGRKNFGHDHFCAGGHDKESLRHILWPSAESRKCFTKTSRCQAHCNNKSNVKDVSLIYHWRKHNICEKLWSFI